MLAGTGRGRATVVRAAVRAEGAGGWHTHLWLARRAWEVSTHAVDVAQRDVAAVPSQHGNMVGATHGLVRVGVRVGVKVRARTRAKARVRVRGLLRRVD